MFEPYRNFKILLSGCSIHYLMAKASSNSKNREAAQFLWPNFLLNVALSLEGTSIRLVRKSWIASTTRSVLYCVKCKLENGPLFFQNIWQTIMFLWLNANCYNHGDINLNWGRKFILLTFFHCWWYCCAFKVQESSRSKIVKA